MSDQPTDKDRANAEYRAKLAREQKAYLRGILDALTGVDAARVTLDKVAKRMSSPAGPRLMEGA